MKLLNDLHKTLSDRYADKGPIADQARFVKIGASVSGIASFALLGSAFASRNPLTIRKISLCTGFAGIVASHDVGTLAHNIEKMALPANYPASREPLLFVCQLIDGTWTVPYFEMRAQ